MIFDVLMVIWLWRLNGRNAIANGQKPGKYQMLTLVLWYGLEILGSFLGAAGIVMLDASANPMTGAYLVGIPCALLGGYISYRLARYAPKGDYHPDYRNPLWNQPDIPGDGQSDPGWERNEVARRWSAQSRQEEGRTDSAYQRADALSRPATVRIVEESGGYSGGRDAFFLNGMPVCMLRPGEEHTFSTVQMHNMLTIGRPGRSRDETDYAVRFIAAEGGYVEVHAAAGRLLPSMFKNYKSV